MVLSHFCPNAKLECLTHCYHGGLHPPHRTCKEGRCWLTFKNLECKEREVKENAKVLVER